MPLIAIDEEDKTFLDEAAAKMAVKKGVKSVTYAYVIHELLCSWEAKP